MVYFDKCRVRINGTGILAESASINSANATEPGYFIGKKGVFNQVPEGPIQHNIQVSYFVHLTQEPVFALTNLFKTITGSYTGIDVEIGGVTGQQCFLTNYSLQSLPNELVKANATFISYVPLSGNFSDRPAGEVVSTYSGNMAMGWTTHVLSGSSHLTAPIYDFNYDYSVNWQPQYILGQSSPTQVDLLGSIESITVTRDVYRHIQFTGEIAVYNSDNAPIRGFSNDQSVDLINYNFIANSNLTSPSLTISISGARLKSSDIDIAVNNFMRNKLTLLNYY